MAVTGRYMQGRRQLFSPVTSPLFFAWIITLAGIKANVYGEFQPLL